MEIVRHGDKWHVAIECQTPEQLDRLCCDIIKMNEDYKDAPISTITLTDTGRAVLLRRMPITIEVITASEESAIWLYLLFS